MTLTWTKDIVYATLPGEIARFILMYRKNTNKWVIFYEVGNKTDELVERQFIVDAKKLCSEMAGVPLIWRFNLLTARATYRGARHDTQFMISQGLTRNEFWLQLRKNDDEYESIDHYKTLAEAKRSAVTINFERDALAAVANEYTASRLRPSRRI
jgi:hypothetical protein